MRDMESMAQVVKLPIRSERAFPRVVNERPRKYGEAWNKNAGDFFVVF